MYTDFLIEPCAEPTACYTSDKKFYISFIDVYLVGIFFGAFRAIERDFYPG